MAIRSRTDLIVLHVSATPPSLDIGAREIDGMHKARGWKGIGYAYVIRRNGAVEKGRPDNQVGAHVEGWNSVSLGICVVGGVDARGKAENNGTPEQYAALERLLQDLLKRYPHAAVCGHRDLSPDGDRDGVIEPHEFIKECPCFDAIPWARSKGLPAAKIRGYWDHGAPPIGALTPPDARTVYLQRLLARAGYAFGPIDGLIGKRTIAAIRQFQLWCGLPQSGKFDEATVARLRARFEQKVA